MLALGIRREPFIESKSIKRSYSRTASATNNRRPALPGLFYILKAASEVSGAGAARAGHTNGRWRWQNTGYSTTLQLCIGTSWTSALPGRRSPKPHHIDKERNTRARAMERPSRPWVYPARRHVGDVRLRHERAGQHRHELPGRSPASLRAPVRLLDRRQRVGGIRPHLRGCYLLPRLPAETHCRRPDRARPQLRPVHSRRRFLDRHPLDAPGELRAAHSRTDAGVAGHELDHPGQEAARSSVACRP